VDENPTSKHVGKSLMLTQSSDSLQSHSGLQGKIFPILFRALRRVREVDNSTKPHASDEPATPQQREAVK
jgi:hypothetical protein